MNNAVDSPLSTLLRRTRRRLWHGRLLSRLLHAAWWSAALLLAGGLVHALYQPLPWIGSLSLAALPPAAALLLGLWRDRPTLPDAAATADRWFDGQSLMASALDQWRRPPRQRTRAGRFVIAAAERCAPLWIERLAHEHRWRPPRHALVPALMGLAGAYLLLLPGPAPRGSAADGTALPAPTASPRHDDAASDFVAGLREALRAARREQPAPGATAGNGAETAGKRSATKAADPARPPGARSATLTTPRPEGTAPSPHRAEAAQTADKGADLTAGPGKRVSDAPGNRTGRPGKARKEPAAAPPLGVTFFPQANNDSSKDATPATARGAGRELAPMPAAHVPGNKLRAARAARWDTDMPYAPSLSAAQRHYVQQYFHNLGESR